MDDVGTYKLRGDTGRMLVLRADGTLYGGNLEKGKAPALARLGDGGWAGLDQELAQRRSRPGPR